MDINYLYNQFKSSAGISTDTRALTENQLFFALKGPNFNANKLAEEALKKGARLAVIDDPEYSSLPNTFLVKDSLSALQKLASHHRSNLDIPVIGLTGSNGKTTTKELLREVLALKYNVLATKGNLNNHIGVPLTILSIDSQDIAIIEMGANHVGEIAALCEISRPTHGFITNIGKAHIGEFGGFENIIRGKSELFDYLRKNNGQVFINDEDAVLSNMAKRFSDPVIYPDGKECSIKLIEAEPFVVFKINDRNEVKTNLIGAYNFQNIAAAICIGNYFKVADDKIEKAISAYTPANNRSQITKLGTNTILLDAYNANPSSMEAAIHNFGKLKAENKMVILGDMLELGDDAPKEHYEVGKLVRQQGINTPVFVGPLMKDAIKAFPEAHYFETKNEVEEWLKRNQPENTFIMIKGSRGMGLETLLEVIKEH